MNPNSAVQIKELEELLQESSRRSRHLWSQLNTMRDCASSGLPIVLSNLQKQTEHALAICETESVRQETREKSEQSLAGKSAAVESVLFTFGYSITEAQSLNCIRIALRADSTFRDLAESRFGKDYVGEFEHAGLVRRAEILLELGAGIKPFVPHMEGDLRVSTLIELSQLRNDILYGPWYGLYQPIAELNGKLEYLRNSCIYLSDLVMLKYDLFRSVRDGKG